MTRGNQLWPTRPLPSEGAFRVAKEPLELPTGPWLPGSGIGRYDDPAGLFAVRYVGGSLECCLKELLDRTRRDDEFEARAARYGTGAGAADYEEDEDLDQYDMPPGADPSLDDYDGWLGNLNVAHVIAADDAGLVVVDHDDVLADLDGHHRIRSALADLAAVLRIDRLTRSLVRDRNRVVYQVTQAISSVVHGHGHRYGGVAYDSCVDETEHCWGLYSRVTVVPAAPERPLLGGGEAEAALQRAAAFVGIDLPPHLFGGDPYPY